MKFREIFRFEFAYQIRRPWTWLIFIILVFLDFLMTRDGSFAEALYSEFFLNSSFGIAKTTVFGGLVWLLSSAATAGEAAARDVTTRMHPLIFTMPISKAQYLGGRFVAALTVNAFILLAIYVGILLGVYLPGVAPELIGPFRPPAFLTSYAFIALPNALFATTIQFTIALRSGRPISAYLGSLLLFFTAFFVASLLLFKRDIGTVLDPIGVRFIWEDLSRLWTTVEKNWRLLSLEGKILHNRLLWLGVGSLFGLYGFLRFRFAHIAGSRKNLLWLSRLKFRKSVISEKRSDNRPERDAQPGVKKIKPQIDFGFIMHARQMLSITWASFRTLATSWAGLALLIFIPLLTIIIVVDQMASIGAPIVPLTSRVIAELTGPLSAEMSRWVIIPGFIIFFAGELVWKERDAGVNEITDAMPGSEWPCLLGKFLGITLMLVLFTALLTTSGILGQTILDYRHFELDLYLKIMFGLQLPEYLLFAVLALLIHVLIDQKYIGHLVAIIVYLFIAILATMMGIEHNLLIYGAGPGWSYTEMRGFGSSIGPWLWFKLYWAAWALLLAVVARLLWVRGKERGFSIRVNAARYRFNTGTAWVTGTALLFIFLVGGCVFYNTNVLHRYKNKSDISEQRAEYERRYSQYANIAQPDLTATKLRVEMYPQLRTVNIRGAYTLANNSSKTIDSIHIAPAMGNVETRSVVFDRTATLAIDDDKYRHRVYTLEDPLMPGDSLQIDFEVHVETKGFSNHGSDPSIENGGTYFTGAWFPSLGYQRERELINAGERRDHGLIPRPVIASLYEVEDSDPAIRGGGIQFEAVIVTGKDQVAVTPGKLLRTWVEGDRRHFHYATSAPIGTEWSFFSADYTINKGQWSDSSGSRVDIQVFHHPTHTGHLERMMRGVQESLEYYTAQFGPYPYNHITVIEHPMGPGTGMHADASLIYHGQAVPFWIPQDEHRFDFPYAVMAHEMSHQWSLPYAFAEGAPFLSEGLAWYSAIQLVKKSRGEEQLRQLMSFMRLPYPHQPIRRGEPLLRALDPYMSYRKGPFAMYALSEYAGSDKVNGVIRKLIQQHDTVGASSVTTLDLYRELQAVTPDSLQYLLHDLFEVNTNWELDTKKVTAVKTETNTWQVTLDVKARKVVYDSAGVESEITMDEWIPIGIFGEPIDNQDELSAPLYLQMHRIHSGEQTITITVPRKPVLAGIDPLHLLDWEEKEDDDNIEGVKIGGKK
jgi:ABC-2 type transport system permease protein